GLDPLTDDFAIRVNTPNPNQGRNLFPTFISRARFQRLGYAFYPEYEGICADDDDCEHILMDERECRTTLVNALALMFTEEHPSFSGAAMDEVYAHMNRPDCYTTGSQILQRRRAQQFGNGPLPLEDRTIGLCIPGETFSATWLAGFARLFTGLISCG